MKAIEVIFETVFFLQRIYESERAAEPFIHSETRILHICVGVTVTNGSDKCDRKNRYEEMANAFRPFIKFNEMSDICTASAAY